MFLSAAYVAGVFYSDGSFTVSRHGRKGPLGYNYMVELQLTWKEVSETFRVMSELKRKYGGSVIRGIERHGFSNGGTYLRYRIGSAQARSLIEDILPHLRVKREQALICLEAATIISRVRYTRWHSRPPSERKRLDELCRRNMNLNWKNGKGRFRRQSIRDN